MSSHRAPSRRKQRRSAPVVASVVVVAVVGAAAAAASVTSPAPRPVDSAGAAIPTEVSTPTAPPEPDTTKAGWAPQTTGEPVTMRNSDGSSDLVSVNVTSIETGFECTADGARPAANGQYIALTVEIRPGDGFAGELEAYPANATDFAALGPDGGQPVMDVSNAATCIPAEDALPPVVTADEPAVGLVVLDAPTETASVLYIPGGWEWPILTKE